MTPTVAKSRPPQLQYIQCNNHRIYYNFKSGHKHYFKIFWFRKQKVRAYIISTVLTEDLLLVTKRQKKCKNYVKTIVT